MVAVPIASPDDSLELLFASEYARVAAIAYRVVADRQDAEDVAQEVFSELASRRAATPTAAWLRVAAVHRALNLLRSRRRRIARERSDFRLDRASSDSRERAGDPLALLDREQTRALVRSAMLGLRPEEAHVLALRYGGSSYREIAESLGVDVNQIGTRLARAERALRKEIERETLR